MIEIKQKKIVTRGGFYYQNCCFLELYMLPFVTNMLERQQIMFWNLYVVFRVLSLLESGNFRWKPTWLVHTTWASIDRVACKMMAGELWVVTKPKNSNMTFWVTWACVSLLVFSTSIEIYYQDNLRKKIVRTTNFLKKGRPNGHFKRGFRHYPYQHRCHKAEQTKNSSASTRLHTIPHAFFAGCKPDANV